MTYTLTTNVEQKYPLGFFGVPPKDYKVFEEYVIDGYENLIHMEYFEYYLPKYADKNHNNLVHSIMKNLPMVLTDLYYSDLRDAFDQVYYYFHQGYVDEEELLQKDYTLLLPEEQVEYDSIMDSIEESMLQAIHLIMSDIQYVLKQNNMFYCMNDSPLEFEVNGLSVRLQTDNLTIVNNPLQEVW